MRSYDLAGRGRVVVALFMVSVFCVWLFHTDDLPNPELHHLYVNEPHPTAPDTMNAHRGTATLRLKGAVLEGDYYTGRGRLEIGALK